MFDLNTYFTDGEIIAIVLFLIGLQGVIISFAFIGVRDCLKKMDKALQDVREILK